MSSFKYYHSVRDRRIFREDARYLFSWFSWKTFNLPKCSEKMVDSGALSGVAKHGMSYIRRQSELIQYAVNQNANRVVMMDIPCFDEFLNKHNITKCDAHSILFKNAEEFSKSEILPQKCYVIQGPTWDDYKKTLSVIKRFAKPEDCICIGGLLGHMDDEEFIIHIGMLVKRHFPTNDVHCLGLGKFTTMRKLINIGIKSFDSSRCEQAGRRMTISMIKGEVQFRDNFGFSPKTLPRRLFSLLVNLAEINMELNFLKLDPYYYGDIIQHSKMGKSFLIKD